MLQIGENHMQAKTRAYYMTSRIRKKHDSYVNELMLNEYLTLLLIYQIADTIEQE